MNKIIGICSECGGNVVLPTIWHGINPPVPTCQNCGAVKQSNLPVIPMKPKRVRKPRQYNHWLSKTSNNFKFRIQNNRS